MSFIFISRALICLLNECSVFRGEFFCFVIVVEDRKSNFSKIYQPTYWLKETPMEMVNMRRRKKKNLTND